MRLKKIACSVFLSVILVLAFASTGVSALSLTDYAPLGTDFTSVVSGQYFARVSRSDVSGYSASNPCYLFNGLSVYYSGSGYFVFDGSTSSYFNWNNSTYIYFWFNGNGQLSYTITGNDYAFGSSAPSSGSIIFVGSYSPLKNTHMDITLGSSTDVVDPPVIDRFQFSLPYGNVLLISSESAFTINRRAYSISNTTYNYQKYVRASDDFSYRVNGSYQGVVENSNVVGTFGLNVFGSNDVMSLLIPWQPVNQNILGRATSYNYYNASPDPTAEVSVLSGQSFMIWYPYYANNQDTSKINETNMEVSIDIYHSAPITFTTFPITGSTASSGEDTYIQNTATTSSSGSSSQSSGGDGSINVTFDNAPSAGGNHGQAPINDNNSILGVLSNLQNTLLGLFNKAIDGIHNLISLGSGFLQSVQIMFSWLPAELLVIITSGFVILLTIGVLKTLWR